MSDDIAFKIQLGHILPKLQDTVEGSLTSIIEELIDVLQKGTLDEDAPVSIDDVKAIIMQDLEIFLDKVVLPPINEKINPPAETAAEGTSEPETPAEEESTD